MKHLFVLIALSVASLSSAIAQSDSVTVSYREEAVDSSDFSLKEKYKYFTRATVEETSMFKVGLSNLGFGSYYGLSMGLKIAYERKINVPFSVLLQYRHQMSGWTSNGIGLDAALRYYYSLPRRIKRGKNANNLSANYFSLQSNNAWGAKYILDGLNSVRDGTRFSTSVSLLYGIQRRLGKRGFVDVNLGGTYHPGRVFYGTERRPFSIDRNFTIGVAF